MLFKVQIGRSGHPVYSYMIAGSHIACVNEQLDPRFATSRHTTVPRPSLGLRPIARKLLLISRPTDDRRLSWPEHTVG